MSERVLWGAGPRRARRGSTFGGGEWRRRLPAGPAPSGVPTTARWQDDAGVLTIGEDVFEFRGDVTLAPAAFRAVAGTTTLDRTVDRLPLPHAEPARAAVRLLRLYRRAIAARLAPRCLLDPSCSRYAEQAVRRYGVVRGAGLGLRRMTRCRRGHGGVDLLY